MEGDEFAVLALEGQPADAEILSGNLQREIALHNESQSRPYVLSASVGTVFYQSASRSLEFVCFSVCDMLT